MTGDVPIGGFYVWGNNVMRKPFGAWPPATIVLIAPSFIETNPGAAHQIANLLNRAAGLPEIPVPAPLEGVRHAG